MVGRVGSQGGIAREAGPVLSVWYQPEPTPQSSAFTVTADTGQQRAKDQPARTSRQADQSKPTPTTLEVSRGAHVLEVVHVDDIDNGGYNPGPVLRGTEEGEILVTTPAEPELPSQQTPLFQGVHGGGMRGDS